MLFQEEQEVGESSDARMASATAAASLPTHAATSQPGHGPLSFMGCMREASPPPRFDETTTNTSIQQQQQQHHNNHHHHHHHNHHRPPVGLPIGADFAHISAAGHHAFDSVPKEPKKRRFHPLRGLRRIFRKKSRGAADARASSSSAERDPANGGDLMSIVRDREEVTLRDPAGRADEIRSRSASELLTESCSDRDRMFLRRRGMEDSFSQLLQKGGAVVGQLSVSHDSVFPGEGSGQRSRPLSSSLEMHASLERRYVKASSASPESKEPQSTQKHRISLRVLEQIKTVIENRNQVAVAGSTATTTTSSSSSTSTSSGAATATTPEGFNSLHNRFGSRDRGERTIDNTQEKGNISSNIRAIIEQLNLNPTERDRLQQCSGSIKQQQVQQRNNHHIASPMMMRLAATKNKHRPEPADRPRVTIGVYGFNNNNHHNSNNNNNNHHRNESNDSCEPKQWSKKIQYDNVEEYKHEKKVLIRKFEANNNVLDLQQVAKKPIKKVNDISGDIIENSAKPQQIVTKNNKLDKEMENIIKKGPEPRKVLPPKIDNANNKLESFLSKPAWSVKPSNNKIEGILKKPLKKIEDCVNDVSVARKDDDDDESPKKPIWKIDEAKKKVEELSKQIMKKFETSNGADEATKVVSVINLTTKLSSDDGAKKNGSNDLRRPLKKIEDKDIKLMSVELVTELQKRKTVHKVAVARPRQRQPAANEIVPVVPLPRKDTSSSSSILDDSGVSLKEDLPELPTGNLSHTAAHHRISVRPKNRRPPRRTTPAATTTTTTTSTTTPTTPPSPTTTTTQALAGESFAVSSTSIDALDSLEEVSSANTSEELTIPSTPTTPVVVTPIVVSAAEPSKPIPILRKSSSRISRNSDVFEELDHQKVPLRPKPQQTAACSPDSLESTTQLDSRSSADVLDEATKPPRPTPRSSSTSSDKSPARRSSAASNRLSKSPDSLESGSPSEWLAKSSNEGLFEITDKEVNGGKPIPARRSLLGPPIPVSKSQERVCSASGSKSDSLEALNSDDSMERRQQHRHSSSGSIVVVGGSSFDVRPRRSQNKLMSKSTECFDTMMMISSSAEQQQLQQQIVKIDEKRKRASVSEVNLSRGGSRFPSKLLQAESFEKFAESSDKLLLPASLRRASGGITPTNNNNNNNNNSSGKRMAHSSESSDNLELDDNCKLENRRRSTPKRLSRLRKNSESSELGSTDTLDSERRNHTMKSSDSDETLDSLEKDLLEPVPVRKGKDEEEQLLQPIQHCDNIPIVAVVERRDDNADETADTKVGAFWRRKTTTTSSNQESKDDKADLDIHQLGGYLLSSKIHENGNNEKQEETSSPVLVYAKKKQMQVMQQQQQHQQQQQAQQPSGGGGVGAGSEEPTKNNQLTNKSDEEVQNMLNGNISEVTTDTRSFKEKLIMFEKLGK